VFVEFLAEQWMLVGALVVAVGLLVQHESRKSGQSLSPQQAINLVNAEDGIFVDLREGSEYGKGHIASAVNIPAPKIDSRLSELDKYKEKPVVLVCKMGQHSGAVGKKLGQAGYSRVYRMSGGMMEWGQQQLPLVKKG
jgi:rhodanese-related sulfurtransferase